MRQYPYRMEFEELQYDGEWTPCTCEGTLKECLRFLTQYVSEYIQPMRMIRVSRKDCVLLCDYGIPVINGVTA